MLFVKFKFNSKLMIQFDFHSIILNKLRKKTIASKKLFHLKKILCFKAQTNEKNYKQCDIPFSSLLNNKQCLIKSN